jgi:hypothetical protein
MAKRTSFDQKAKGTHKSRQKIIDTVFGREDNTQHTFGYEGEVEPDRNVGDIWTDKDGKTWEQKEGFKISVTKFDEIRDYLKSITNCNYTECTTETYDIIDKKTIAKTNMCFSCLQKFERKLRQEGLFEYYEDYKITNNKLSYARDLKSKLEQSLKDVSTQLQMVNEDGTIQNWVWDIDIKKVKDDIQADIDDIVETIELILERLKALEDKFIELKRPDLIN